MESGLLCKSGQLVEPDLTTKLESTGGNQNVASAKSMLNVPTSTATTLLVEQKLDKLLLESNSRVESSSDTKLMGGNDPIDRNLAPPDGGGSDLGKATDAVSSDNTSPQRDRTQVNSRSVKTEFGLPQNIGAKSALEENPHNKLLDHDVSSPSSVVYYGVCRPPTATVEDDDLVGVYTDKKEALRAVKKYKGARFKAFKSNSEATAFASLLPDETFNSPSCVGGSIAMAMSVIKDSETSFDSNGASGEKPSPFRPPKPQDLVKLRKGIESDDLEYVEQTIWSNPRYLISSGDTPAILQEGSRYNALHVAAKFKRFAMVKLVLDVIESKEFMQLLYSDDAEETCLQRIDFLIDLYLNTPDKGLCETPLHFAAKFGCAKIVEVLTSYPACDRLRRNKYGQAANDIVCSRCPNNGSSDLRAEIEEYLQDRYYVPVLRTEDNSSQPLVGVPWSPAEAKQLVLNSSPSQPQQLPLTVKAYAGPMSPQQAKEFHKRLKTPTRSRRRVAEAATRSQDIRLSDTEKGLERVGREIAKEMKVLWTEYWSFLKGFCDITKPEGLNKLELYLKCKFNELMAKECNRSFDSETSDCFLEDKNSSNVNLGNRLNLNSSQNSSGVGALCEALDKLQLNLSMSSSSGCNSSRFEFAVGENRRQLPNSNHSSNGSQGTQYKPTTTSNGSPRTMNVANFLERTCQVVASQIYAELSRFAEAQQDYWCHSDLPFRLFTKALLPAVECLQNIVSNLRLCDELKGSDFKVIHFNVTRKACESIEEDDNVFVRDFVEKIGSFPEGSTEYFSEQSDISDEEREGAEHVSKWGHRRQRNHQKKRCLSVMMQQHLRCILNLMMQLSKQQKAALKLNPIECSCSWFAYYPEGMSAPNSPAPSYPTEELATSKASGGVTTGQDIEHASSAPVVCLSRELCKPEIGDTREFNFSPTKSDSSVYFTPPSSRCSSLSEMESVDEGPALFMEGLFPTKIDLDILRAIQNIQIDPSQYPFIYRWQNTITSYPTEVIESWPSPSCPRARQGAWTLSSSPISTPARQSFSSCSSAGVRGRPLSSTPILLSFQRSDTGDMRTNLLKAFNSPISGAD